MLTCYSYPHRYFSIIQFIWNEKKIYSFICLFGFVYYHKFFTYYRVTENETRYRISESFYSGKIGWTGFISPYSYDLSTKNQSHVRFIREKLVNFCIYLFSLLFELLRSHWQTNRRSLVHTYGTCAPVTSARFEGISLFGIFPISSNTDSRNGVIRLTRQKCVRNCTKPRQSLSSNMEIWGECLWNSQRLYTRDKKFFFQHSFTVLADLLTVCRTQRLTMFIRLARWLTWRAGGRRREVNKHETKKSVILRPHRKHTLSLFALSCCGRYTWNYGLLEIQIFRFKC